MWDGLKYDKITQLRLLVMLTLLYFIKEIILPNKPLAISTRSINRLYKKAN